MNEKKAEQAKELQVHAQISRLGQNLAELKHALDELRSRLVIVLRDDKDEDREEAVEPPLVPLAADIRDFTYRVREMTSEVIGMLEELEL